MPPRAMKKAGNASGGKKTPAKSPKVAAKAQAQPVVEEATKIETKEEIRVEETVSVVVEEQKVEEEAPSQPESESKPEANGSVDVKEKEDVQMAYDEVDKGERLDLDDNEYDPEEETGVDYDEKGIEDQEPQGEGDGEEEHEEGDGGDMEEGDMGDEEMEDLGEEVEGVGDEEHAEDKHAEDEHVEEEHEELADREHEEHHEVVKERRKRKEFEVFVGGLDKDASEDDLKKVFSVAGEIVEVRLMMNPQTKKNKGFAFLRFATVEQAKRVVKELKNPVVIGKQCVVTASQDSDSLFLGNICKTWTKDALKEKLKQYEIDRVEDLTLAEDSNNEGMNHGFAFLEFSSHSDAMDAFKPLQKRDVMFGVDRNVKVVFADSFIESDDEVMAQVKTVFVDGLPTPRDEDRVKEQLKEFGEIEKVELARNMPSAKTKDFGFVTFDTHDNAVVCAESIHNAELGDADNKVKVRARLSRPLQRGRGNHAARGDFRSGRSARRGGRMSPWARPAPRNLPDRSLRGVGGRLPPARGHGFKGHVGFRVRRPVMSMPERARAMPPPPPQTYSRKPVASYPRSSSKRDFVRRDELPPRSRAAVDYGSRAVPERRSSYKVDHTPRGPSYSDEVPCDVDEPYEQSFERPPPSYYHDVCAWEYDSVSGSKRPYSALDDVPPRYAEAGVCLSRAPVDYGVGGNSSQYSDTYGDRVGRYQLGYSGSRNSLSAQDAYGSPPGMSYAGGSYSGDVGGPYSSSCRSDYMPRGPDMGDGSYSSLYSSRSLGESGGYDDNMNESLVEDIIYWSPLVGEGGGNYVRNESLVDDIINFSVESNEATFRENEAGYEVGSASFRVDDIGCDNTELYENFQAPKFYDFDKQSVDFDNEAWSCEPEWFKNMPWKHESGSCEHPKKADDLLELGGHEESFFQSPEESPSPKSVPESSGSHGENKADTCEDLGTEKKRKREEITLEFHSGEEDLEIPLPSIINLSICGSNPPPAATESNVGSVLLDLSRNAAAHRFSAASNACGDGKSSLDRACLALSCGDSIQARPTSKQQQSKRKRNLVDPSPISNNMIQPLYQSGGSSGHGSLAAWSGRLEEKEAGSASPGFNGVASNACGDGKSSLDRACLALLCGDSIQSQPTSTQQKSKRPRDSIEPSDPITKLRIEPLEPIGNLDWSPLVGEGDRNYDDIRSESLGEGDNRNESREEDNTESIFEEGELHENFQAPKLYDFDKQSVDNDDEAWLGKPECGHPKTAEEFLQLGSHEESLCESPEAASSPKSVLESLLDTCSDMKEEEALIAAHRKQMEDTIEILNQEIKLWTEVNEPGNQIDNYLTQLSLLVSRKAESLVTLQAHLARFQHLRFNTRNWVPPVDC